MSCKKPYEPALVGTPDDVRPMTPRQFKAYEARVRRAVARRGLALRKLGRRDPNAVDSNQYVVQDPNWETGRGGTLIGRSLTDVARWLTDNPDVKAVARTPIDWGLYRAQERGYEFYYDSEDKPCVLTFMNERLGDFANLEQAKTNASRDWLERERG